MKLALEAKHLWRTDPLYKDFYYERGLVWADINRSEFSKNVIANYEGFGVKGSDEKCELVTPDAIRDLNHGLFSGADLGDLTEVLLNESSGWVEARETLQKVIDAAVSTGVVKYIETDISSLILDEDRSVCTGARSVDGQVFISDSVILATGAETARLLVKSSPETPELHVGSRMSAAGLITGVVKLGQKDAEQFRSGPAFLLAGGEGQGGMIPPNAENELKITCDLSFTNTIEICNGNRISTPPSDPLSNYSAFAAEMNHALATVSEHMLGDQGQAFEYEDCRICWDAITPDQNFIICQHPRCKHLFMATGGSFHSWKFFPILGKYVVQMLEGQLDQSLAQRWAWDRDSITSTTNERMMPVREMRDLKRNRSST
ncbi:FAD dependent oxidoreductase [Talaromyces proteolyticus]|uniref:FAD dependent oxidoreductase n=1 Tax=Talaromyces proteolyticus TaxID=1131652 RepID=A0AAD4Q740_9EURO|nr:FAD dependent oxidoreductase [Talaromyces proteolyticus]KAH8705957.1 FAD dependent oxidoreductase [Talaromyces proteolyticus]